MMQTVLITGGTGLVGSALCGHLVKNGYAVIILTRTPAHQVERKGVRYAAWNVKSQTIDAAAVQQADYILHLAGAGVVDKKWTPAYKEEIRNSRTQSSKLLIDTLKTNSHHVKAIISSSAIGWYGPDQVKGHAFTEADPAAGDFLGQTCLLWEQSIAPATTLGIRVCSLRTGIVLSNDGGALPEFKKPLRFGVAGIMDGGKQMMSWIHIDDLCRMFLHAMETSSMQGSYNAVAPSPVSNKAFTAALGEAMRGRFFIPVHIPSFLLKLVMGERSTEVLKSTTVNNDKIKKTGFTFLYPSLPAALDALI
jgi:hypothetical protein